LAGEAARAPTTAPTTQPSGQDRQNIKALIGQLAADDFRTRDRASEELRRMGTAALPALKEAAADPDPEIQGRAKVLVKEIEGGGHKPEPKQPSPNISPGRLNKMSNSVRVEIRTEMRMGVATSRRDVQVNENGRKIHIREDDQGVKITVTEPVDGKDVTTEYKAKDAEELKKSSPEGYRLYESYGRKAMGRERIDIDLE
jgi:hypothetical protein